MNLIYGILGVAARFTERSSRTRGNGIPMNWAVLFLLAMLTGAAGVKLREAIVNRGQPRSVTLAQLLDGDGMSDAHVVVPGRLDPDNALAQQAGDDKTAKPKAIYVPLVDGTRAIYVSMPGDGAFDHDSVRGGKVRGMVRGMDKELSDHLASSRAPAGPAASLDTRYVIAAGETPANPGPWGALVGLGILIMLTMLLAMARRYVIFRRTRPAGPAANPWGPTPLRPMAGPKPPPPPPPAEPSAPVVPGGMRVSGRFTFEQNPKLRKRFLDVPALLAEMASGDVGLVSRIDASVRFHGHVTRNRDGIWAVVMKAGTGAPPEEGLLYAGFRPRPALRVRYIDATTGRPGTAVLSFPDEPSREATQAQLLAATAPAAPVQV